MWWAIAFYDPTDPNGQSKAQGCMALETDAKMAIEFGLLKMGYKVASRYVARLSDAEAFVNMARNGWSELVWQ